jgi:hypothetical protein
MVGSVKFFFIIWFVLSLLLFISIKKYVLKGKLENCITYHAMSAHCVRDKLVFGFFFNGKTVKKK